MNEARCNHCGAEFPTEYEHDEEMLDVRCPNCHAPGSAKVVVVNRGVPSQTEEEVEKSKVIEVTLDMDFKDVLKLDRDGRRLTFNPEVGKFRELTDKELGRLSNFSRDVYVACRGLHQQEIKAQELPPIPGLKIRGSYATATQRLQVDYPPGYRDKFATAWKRPDEWRQAHYDGWTVADDVELKGAHFGSHTGGGEGPITVGAGGETELLLMKMPKEMKEQRQRATSEKSRGRAKKVEQSTISEMRRAGGVPYVPPEKESSDGHNWS